MCVCVCARVCVCVCVNRIWQGLILLQNTNQLL